MAEYQNFVTTTRIIAYLPEFVHSRIHLCIMEEEIDEIEEVGKEFSITIYLEKEEWDIIEANAKNMGISLEEYIKGELVFAGDMARGQLQICAALSHPEKIKR